MNSKKQEMLKFLQLVKDCTLDVDQKLKWLKKFREGEISQVDYNRFHDEVEASLVKANVEMEQLAKEIAAGKANLSDLEGKAMKEFNEMYPKLVAEIEAEVKDFEQEANEITDNAYAAAEGAKGATEEAEIDAIKRQLGQ